MGAYSIPAVFGFLSDEANAAADAALVDVLPDLEPAHQRQALGILCKRNDSPALTNLVGRFAELSNSLQSIITEHAGDLFTAIRLATTSPDLADRTAAIGLIVRSKCGPLLYLLADALRHGCPQTRELAANGLHNLTHELLDRFDMGPDAAELDELEALADAVADALEDAIVAWEVHLQPKILEAALWMGSRTVDSIRQKLEDRRTKIAIAICDILEGTSDPSLADFTLRALAIPALCGSAARAIGGAANVEFRRAIVSNACLLVDPEIERGCRRITRSPWLHGSANELLQLGHDDAAAAVALITATGGPLEQKLSILEELISVESDVICRAVVWYLVRDETDAATHLLEKSVGRCGGDIAGMIKQELQRRRPTTNRNTPAADLPDDVASHTASRRAFEQYWNEFDNLDPAQHRTIVRSLMEIAGSLLPPIREKLSSSQPADRRRALGMVRSLALTKQAEEWVYRLAHDPDALVRSKAVATLADLPGHTSHRILRASLKDQDERVQANAIEALDVLGLDSRVADTTVKLGSTNSRIRANAVKSLLRADVKQAGETLVSMLGDSSSAQRISALWVVERLQLRTIIARVSAISANDPDHRVRQRAQRVLRHLESHRDTHSELPISVARPEDALSTGGAVS